MKDLQAVLFDLDGTLIDSEHFYFSNWSPVLAEHFDLHITYDEWLTYFAGHTLVRNVSFMRDQWAIETTEEFMWQATRANYAKADMRTINLMPYVHEVLDYLKENEIRIGLVTSSYQTTVDTVLGHHGLKEFFEFFVTRESVTHAKPNAEPYLLGIAKLGLPASAICAVEDTGTGLRAAKAAGLTCVAVSSQMIERSRLRQADYLLKDLKDFLQLIKEGK